MTPRSGSYDILGNYYGQRTERRRTLSSRLRIAAVRVSNEAGFFSNSMRSACQAGIERELRRRNGA
jgi:hypothetical protein